MIAGPWRAPSSPPETPTPRNGRSSVSIRRIVSRKFALPASMIRSSASRYGSSAAIWSSTGAPAGTIKSTARGPFNAAANASSVSHGTTRAARSPASSTKAWVLDVVRLNTATVNPFSAMLSANADPIVPSPITAISAFAMASSRLIAPTLLRETAERHP